MTRKFPLENLGKFQTISVLTNDGQTVEINYQDLKLVNLNGQICFYYQSVDGDLFMPIAREVTIEKLSKLNIG